jgi:hypothetical protein
VVSFALVEVAPTPGRLLSDETTATCGMGSVAPGGGIEGACALGGDSTAELSDWTGIVAAGEGTDPEAEGGDVRGRNSPATAFLRRRLGRSDIVGRNGVVLHVNAQDCGEPGKAGLCKAVRCQLSNLEFESQRIGALAVPMLDK